MKQWLVDHWNGIHSESASMVFLCLIFAACALTIGYFHFISDTWIQGTVWLIIGPAQYMIWRKYWKALDERDKYRKELGIGKRLGCEMYQEMVRLRKERGDVVEKN